MNKRLKVSKLSLLFYVLACLLLLYTCYSFYVSYDYIKGAIENGVISWNSGFHEIIKYYMSYSAPYAFYTLTFVFFGYVSNYIAECTKEKEEVQVENDETLVQDTCTMTEVENNDEQNEQNDETAVQETNVKTEIENIDEQKEQTETINEQE